MGSGPAPGSGGGCLRNHLGSCGFARTIAYEVGLVSGRGDRGRTSHGLAGLPELGGRGTATGSVVAFRRWGALGGWFGRSRLSRSVVVLPGVGGGRSFLDARLGCW